VAAPIVACYIVLNEEEYIAPSLESIYDKVDRIIIVEGGNDYAVKAGWCGPDKRSTDRTVEIIADFPDPDHKIELISGAWRDKAEQRNAYAKRLREGDWMLLMDGDEVFFEDGFWRLAALMHKFEIICPGYYPFWNRFDVVATGMWEDFLQVKVVKWHKGYHYVDHNCPSDASGRRITYHRALRTKEKLFAHYAWVKPLDKLRKKAAYYQHQPGSRKLFQKDYIESIFLAWRRGEPIPYTHPFGGGGWKWYRGKHPRPIQRRLDAGEYQWDLGKH